MNPPVSNSYLWRIKPVRSPNGFGRKSVAGPRRSVGRGWALDNDGATGCLQSFPIDESTKGRTLPHIVWHGNSLLAQFQQDSMSVIGATILHAVIHITCSLVQTRTTGTIVSQRNAHQRN